MSEEASITPLVSHLRQLSSLYQRLGSESKDLQRECKQTGSQLVMLQQLLEGLPNSPTVSTTVTSLCEWAADKLQVHLVLLWILDVEGERLWTLLPEGEVVYAPFGEEGITILLHPSFSKDVTTVCGKEVAWDLEQRLLSDAGALPHRFSMIGLVRNEMGEGSAVLQAVNSLRNEENNFTQEDEICLKGILPTVSAVAGLVKAMFELESALADAFCGRSTQSGRRECINGGGSSEEMKDQDDDECIPFVPFVPRDWLIDKLLQQAAKAVGAVSCEVVLYDRRRSNNVGSDSPSLHPIPQELEERMVITSSPVLAPGTGVFLGKLLTTFVAENESRAEEALPSYRQEAFLADVSVVIGTLLASAFKTCSDGGDTTARTLLACQDDDRIGMCKAVASKIKLVVACTKVKACIGVPDQEQQQQQSRQSQSMAFPPSDEGGKNKWIGFSVVSGSDDDIGVSVSGTLVSKDLPPPPEEDGGRNIGVKDMERLLLSASQSSSDLDLLRAHEQPASLSLTENDGSSGGIDVTTTCGGIFLERCVAVPLACGCGIVAVIERGTEDDPFSPLEMSAIVNLGYELGVLVSMRMRAADKGEEEGQWQDDMISRKGMGGNLDESFTVSRIGMKEENVTSVCENVREFAQAIPLPMALNPHNGGVDGQFLYSSRSSILPEALVSVICSIVHSCVSIALYDHVSLDDNGVEPDDDMLLLQETTDDEKIVRCRAIALRCVLNGTTEWTSAQSLLHQATVRPDSQPRMFLHQSTRFDSSSKNAGSSVQCSSHPPHPLEADAAISGVSLFYVPLPGRDAALELACTEESKAVEHVALAIAPFFSTFLAWRDKVTVNLVSRALKAFSIAVQRIAFRHLAIHSQREVKLKLELQMEDMKAERLNEREKLRCSLLEMEKERLQLCKQLLPQSSHVEEGGGGDRSTTTTTKSRDEKKYPENVPSTVREEEDVSAVQQPHESIIEQQQNMVVAALENELLSVKELFSKERKELVAQLDELQGISTIKEALELQTDTLKSEMMLIREEQLNDNNQWQLQVEELQSKLATVMDWHENGLKENEELQKHVELMSISLRDANIENAYVHEHFKDLESELNATQKEKDDGFRMLTENVQELQQHLCDCTLRLKNTEDEKQRLQSELDHVVSSTNEDNRVLRVQLEELKSQLQKTKNKENELHSELVVVEKERNVLNERFLRNSQDLELKLSAALAEKNGAIQVKSNALELAKQQLEDVKLNARREIDTLQLKLEEECTKLSSMTDSHTTKERLLQSQIEETQRILYLEKSEHDSELKTAIQYHLGTDLTLPEEISSFGDLLSHLEAKHSFEIREREKVFRFQMDSAESRLMEEKAGLQSKLDDTRVQLRALQDDILTLSNEKECTKSKLDSIQDVLQKERFEFETELQKERESWSQAFEKMRQLPTRSEQQFDGCKSGDELRRATQTDKSQQIAASSSSNSFLNVEVGVASDGDEYSKLHPAELISLLKIRNEAMSTLAKRLHDTISEKSALQGHMQHEMDLLESKFLKKVAILQSRLTEENNNRMELYRRNVFSTWRLITAMQLKEKQKSMEERRRPPSPDNDGYNNHLSLIAPPASPHSISLCHETSSHYSMVSSASSSSTRALLQGLVETLSAPPDFSSPSDLPSLAKCVQNFAMGLFGVGTAHLYVVDAARGVLNLCLSNGRLGGNEESEGDVMKWKKKEDQITLTSGVPHTVLFGKGLVGSVALKPLPQFSIDIHPETPDRSIEILCMPVMLRASSDTTHSVWYESKHLEVGDDDDLESEDVEVLGVLRISRMSFVNQDGDDLEEDLGIGGFTGDDARVVATFCGQVALALSSLQRRVELCHKLEEIQKEKTTVIEGIHGNQNAMTREMQRLRARLNIAEARLIAARKKRVVAGEKMGRWDRRSTEEERGLLYSKRIPVLIEKQRAMQSTAILLNSENARLRRDLEKERDERAQDKEKEQKLLPVLLGLRQLHERDTKCVEKHKRQKKRSVR